MTHEKVCMGGDFAGLKATFSASGKFLPIPEYLVPAELLEWGQEPSSLEVLVSEEAKGKEWERQIISVLPAIGCAIDNLETQKSCDTFSTFSRPSESTLALYTSTELPSGVEGRVHRTEAISHYQILIVYGFP